MQRWWGAGKKGGDRNQETTPSWTHTNTHRRRTGKQPNNNTVGLMMHIKIKSIIMKKQLHVRDSSVSQLSWIISSTLAAEVCLEHFFSCSKHWLNQVLFSLISVSYKNHLVDTWDCEMDDWTVCINVNSSCRVMKLRMEYSSIKTRRNSESTVDVSCCRSVNATNFISPSLV